MATSRSRKTFYEISPGWPGGESMPVKMGGWSDSLTTSKSFDWLEQYYGKNICSEGTLQTKTRPIPDLIHGLGYSPIITAEFKFDIRRSSADGCILAHSTNIEDSAKDNIKP